MQLLLFNADVKAGLYKTPDLLARLELIDAAKPHEDQAWARAHEIFSIREELTQAWRTRGHPIPPRQAHQASRMTTFHLTDESRAFYRKFGAYLGEEIDVYCPGRQRYGRLMGLPYCEPGGRPKADVLLYYTDTEVAEEVLFDCVDDLHNVLPCLYAFEDLPNELPDGTVPAMVIMQMEGRATLPNETIHYYKSQYGAERVEWRAGGEVVMHNGTWLSLYPDFTTGEFAQKRVSDYLRRNHFAVGLAPHEFHRKTAPVIALQ